ncbi:hypothetical protein [Streptomyces sp. IBSBF 3136]
MRRGRAEGVWAAGQLGTGHFALETRLPEIAPLIAGFLDRARE